MTIAISVPTVNIDKVRIRLARNYDLAAMEWNGEFSKYRRIYATAYDRMKRLLGLIWLADYSPYGVIGQAMVDFKGKGLELTEQGAPAAYLHGFRIKPQFRHAYVGTRMLRHIEADLVTRKFEVLTLTVGKENYPAQLLYSSAGYHITGEDPGRWSYIDNFGRKQEVVEPAYVMRKKLAP